MNEFEKEYYESDEFWKDDMLQDESNINRFKITESLIPADVNSLADIGCGNGVFVNYLLSKKPSFEIHAVDRSNKALEYVKAKKTNADITDLPFANGYFDCVTCLEVLEHLTIKDYSQALKELTRISSKYIIVSVPYAERVEESYTKCPACKSVFNYELHLRSFSDKSFENLFSELGYRNVNIQKLGESAHYIGHFEYRKLFYPEQLLKWRSSVCPICGYKDKQKKSPQLDLMTPHSKGTKRKLISYLSWLPKALWPKEKRYYWILGLFQKV